MFRLAFFAGLVVYVAAQSWAHTKCPFPSLTEIVSPQCLTALQNIAGNNDAKQCLALNITALEPVIQAANSNTSIVAPLNTWLGYMCNASPCSNATIAAVVTNLTTGCSTDFNISSDPTLITTVQSLYPTIRKILCLKEYVWSSIDPRGN
jgi:hypothetical protein